MAPRKLERRNYGGKWTMSIKYQNLHTFKEGLITLCQSILETRRITHLHGSAHFTIPLKVEQPWWQMAIMTERIKNHQAKNHFAHDQKHAKKIKRSIENNLSKNGCTATNNDTFQMFGIPANKISKDLLQKLSSLGVSVKKVLLKISRNS